MTSGLAGAAVALSSIPMVWILVKVTMALALGLVATRIAYRARASVRHVILASTLAVAALLPLAAFRLPDVVVAVPIENPLMSASPASTTRSVQPITAPPPATVGSGQTMRFSIVTIVGAAWALGAIMFAASFSIALWRLRDIKRHALPALAARTQIRDLEGSSGIRRPVDVVLHEDVTAPFTYGVVRPAIVLPPAASDWPDEALRRALIHELEHVRRGDWWTQLAARAICVAYWFHPLGWMAYRQLCLEAERACDDAVLAGEEHTMYAEQLVNLARRLAARTSQPAIAMANRSDLAKRVSAVLDANQVRGRAGLLRGALVVLTAVAIAISIAPVRLMGAPTRALIGEGKAFEAFQRALGSTRAIDRALVEAAAEGSMEDVTDLVDKGADINATVLGDGSPLIAAAREGRLGTVTFLLDRGADPNHGVSGDGNPLIMAAREGHVTIVELLLNRGADVERVVPGDENAMIQASGEGRLAVVKVLVARGANVNARVWVDDSGGRSGGQWRTPLSVARTEGRRDVVAFLLAAGAVE
jgi:beta-lactamase regulating signal transducer with metallopeptidase domain